MSTKKIAKTNAARLLERLGIPFTLHQAEVDESDLSAVTMARKQAARVPAETLKRCMDFCAEADFAFKSGKMPALSAYRNALLNILNA